MSKCLKLKHNLFFSYFDSENISDEGFQTPFSDHNRPWNSELKTVIDFSK